MRQVSKLIVIDPPTAAYSHDKIFDESNIVLNRDDTLSPFIRLRAAAVQRGIGLHTADRISTQISHLDVACDYYSLGMLTNFQQFQEIEGVKLKAFIIFEPPVVDRSLYQALPELTAAFERVYIHNTLGDGYSLNGVDRSKLRQLYWPQPRLEVIEPFWSRQLRQRRIVIINGNHRPKSLYGELYSKRIEAMVRLADTGVIDLYGRGWERWWARSSMWAPYWLNRKTLMSIYKGSCESKYEVLSDYTFALCFENMSMRGYVTEKIFDCFYAGTIPLYLGASDIAELIPSEAYVDCRRFTSWAQMSNEVLQMSAEEIDSMREAGRAFIRSERNLRYYNFLVNEVLGSEVESVER